MPTKKTILIFILLTAATPTLRGAENHISIGTNTLGYLNFLTPNITIGMSLSRHWSIHLEGRYNAFDWNISSHPFQNKQLTGSLNARYWSWYVYSGWFYSIGIQYSRYNHGGIIAPLTEEGDAIGIGFQAGYSLMLTKRINMEFGLGGWGGWKKYKTYSAPRCGKLTADSDKLFFMPNNINISIVYTF